MLGQHSIQIIMWVCHGKQFHACVDCMPECMWGVRRRAQECSRKACKVDITVMQLHQPSSAVRGPIHPRL